MDQMYLIAVDILDTLDLNEIAPEIFRERMNDCIEHDSLTFRRLRHGLVVQKNSKTIKFFLINLILDYCFFVKIYFSNFT